MYFYTMTITEECTQNEEPSMLQLWENRDGKIWIQCGYDEMEPHGMHGIAITPDDARALIAELTRLVKEIESNTTREVDGLGDRMTNVPDRNNAATLPEVGLTRKQNEGTRVTTTREVTSFGLNHKQSSAFQQIADIPEERPGQGKQLSISKVNWGGK